MCRRPAGAAYCREKNEGNRGGRKKEEKEERRKTEGWRNPCPSLRRARSAERSARS